MPSVLQQLINIPSHKKGVCQRKKIIQIVPGGVTESGNCEKRDLSFFLLPTLCVFLRKQFSKPIVKMKKYIFAGIYVM